MSSLASVSLAWRCFFCRSGVLLGLQPHSPFLCWSLVIGFFETTMVKLFTGVSAVVLASLDTSFTFISRVSEILWRPTSARRVLYCVTLFEFHDDTSHSSFCWSFDLFILGVNWKIGLRFKVILQALGIKKLSTLLQISGLCYGSIKRPVLKGANDRDPGKFCCFWNPVIVWK